MNAESIASHRPRAGPRPDLVSYLRSCRDRADPDTATRIASAGLPRTDILAFAGAAGRPRPIHHDRHILTRRVERSPQSDGHRTHSVTRFPSLPSRGSDAR